MRRTEVALPAMAVKEILILTESPFSKRDYDRFGVELLSQSFGVSILDCTQWLKPDFWDSYSKTAFPCPGYRAVENFDSFRRCLDRTQGGLAIDYLGDSSNAKRIRVELKKQNIGRVIYFHGLLPVYPERLLTNIRRRVKRIFAHEPAPDVAVMSGEVGLTDARVPSAPHKIWAHSLDYDIYLRERSNSSRPSSPYAVFLDEDMIYHSDYHHSGTTSPTKAEVYYPAMRGFFERLERTSGMPVKIATHPRSNLDLQRELWNGHETVNAMTSQLVRGASLVLCHLSTSLAFAVLWRKRLLFLTTNDL